MSLSYFSDDLDVNVETFLKPGDFRSCTDNTGFKVRIIIDSLLFYDFLRFKGIFLLIHFVFTGYFLTATRFYIVFNDYRTLFFLFVFLYFLPLKELLCHAECFLLTIIGFFHRPFQPIPILYQF